MSTLVTRTIQTPDGSPVSFPNGIRVGTATGAGSINHIGVAGQQGFGVGIAPELPAGFAKLYGTEDPASDAYGNYQYLDGSVMVYMPAFYYKYGTGANGFALNLVDIKPFGAYAAVADANAAGYALHRAFYNAGSIRPGVFVDKYLCSNNAGTASSIKNGNPLSSAAAHNPFAGLTGAPANIYAGAIAAAKIRGSRFFCNSRFIRAALALLANAHGSASTGTTYNAWYSAGATNFPKGNNNNALGDGNDATLAFVSDGYPNAAKTGSANFFARTTHNGQSCGVADLNGNLWEIELGLTANTPSSTAAGYTSAATGFAIGTTVIPLITGSGTVVAGDMVTFAGDVNQYAVTVGISAPGSITIAAPGLKQAIPAAATALSVVPASYYLLKTSADVSAITGGNAGATDAWGATGLAALYDNIGATYEALLASSTAKTFGNAAQVLSAAASGTAWAAAGAGIPLAGGVGGSNQFGSDGLWDYRPNELCVISGGDWSTGGDAGVWALHLSNVRGTSSDTVGFRSASYL